MNIDKLSTLGNLGHLATKHAVGIGSPTRSCSVSRPGRSPLAAPAFKAWISTDCGWEIPPKGWLKHVETLEIMGCLAPFSTGLM